MKYVLVALAFMATFMWGYNIGSLYHVVEPDLGNGPSPELTFEKPFNKAVNVTTLVPAATREEL
jgi:hypothetical protein